MAGLAGRLPCLTMGVILICRHRCAVQFFFSFLFVCLIFSFHERGHHSLYCCTVFCFIFYFVLYCLFFLITH